MIDYYSELENEKLINYAASLSENVQGIFSINKIFNEIKNKIEFDLLSKEFQTASKTLVMGRGNNFSKNMLLYSILKINDFDCCIKIKYVVDNTFILSHKSKKIPWYYVYVNYFGKELELDCSFDKGFMKATGIFNKETNFNYKIEDYFNSKGEIFKIVSDKEIILNDDILKKATKNERIKL